jgi:hypothetical protein
MNIAATIPDFNAPVVDHARKDFPLLRAGMTVGEALERIRREGVGERVIYFYAIDEQDRLVGVVGNAITRDHGAACCGRSCDSNDSGGLRIFRPLQISGIPGRGRAAPRGRHHRREPFRRRNFGGRR